MVYTGEFWWYTLGNSGGIHWGIMVVYTGEFWWYTLGNSGGIHWGIIVVYTGELWWYTLRKDFTTFLCWSDVTSFLVAQPALVSGHVGQPLWSYILLVVHFHRFSSVTVGDVVRHLSKDNVAIVLLDYRRLDCLWCLTDVSWLVAWCPAVGSWRGSRQLACGVVPGSWLVAWYPVVGSWRGARQLAHGVVPDSWLGAWYPVVGSWRDAR